MDLHCGVQGVELVKHVRHYAWNDALHVSLLKNTLKRGELSEGNDHTNTHTNAQISRAHTHTHDANNSHSADSNWFL